MKILTTNGYSDLERLSDIELYYSAPENFSESSVKISGEEYKHISKVMRHKLGDELHITDGKGSIVKGNISGLQIDSAVIEIREIYKYENKFKNITFCVPKLRNPNRFEFGLEKCTELGITNFIIYESLRTVAKGTKIDRWEKILLSAMKQSLRSFLPEIKILNSINDIMNLKGEKIIFEQNCERRFSEFQREKSTQYYFIFGPEGGLDKEEIESAKSVNVFNLDENRLRSETAIVKCASMLG